MDGANSGIIFEAFKLSDYSTPFLLFGWHRIYVVHDAVEEYICY